jgi:hypothetical protein
VAAGWYELERLVKGQWIVDTIFDDKDIAISEAERLIDGRRAMAVRVKWSDDSDRPPRTIFRKSSVDDATRGTLNERAAAHVQAVAARKRRRAKAAANPRVAPSARSRAVRSIGRIVATGAFCAALIGGVWYLSQITTRLPGEAGTDYGPMASGGGAGPTIHWGGGRN